MEFDDASLGCARPGCVEYRESADGFMDRDRYRAFAAQGRHEPAVVILIGAAFGGHRDDSVRCGKNSPGLRGLVAPGVPEVGGPLSRERRPCLHVGAVADVRARSAVSAQLTVIEPVELGRGNPRPDSG
jgi:hypothetical protein